MADSIKSWSTKPGAGTGSGSIDNTTQTNVTLNTSTINNSTINTSTIDQSTINDSNFTGTNTIDSGSTLENNGTIDSTNGDFVAPNGGVFPPVIPGTIDNQIQVDPDTGNIYIRDDDDGVWRTNNASGGMGSGVNTVLGNIVDNTDPANPVVTQVQPDWSATTGLGEILNKAVRPDETNGTTTNGKIVVRDTNSFFRDATASDITALGFTSSLGGGTIYISSSFSAVLGINTVTHSLGLNQTDVESGRYSVYFSYKRTSPPIGGRFEKYPEDSIISEQRLQWTASNPALISEINFQTNTLKFLLNNLIYSTYRVFIVQNF